MGKKGASRDRGLGGREVLGDEDIYRANTKQSLDDISEQMLEKRFGTRENALRDLAAKLAEEYQYEEVAGLKNTLVEGLKKSFKKGRDTERSLAATALNIIVLTLGADADEIYTEFEPSLVRAIADHSGDSPYSPEARADFITALALLSFIASPDSASTKLHMTLFEEFFSRIQPIPELQEYAVRGWTLLCTALDAEYVLSKPMTQQAKPLAALLDSSDVDVRMAAGEAIALMFALLNEHAEAHHEGGNYSYDPHELGADLLDTYELMDKLQDLSVSKDRQKNKKECLKQKGTFKQIVRSIEEADEPEETLVISSQSINFSGWLHVIRLNAIRDQLAGGLQTHFENNELLQQVLEFDLQKGRTKRHMSKQEKRMYLSPHSALNKARSRDRQRNSHLAVPYD